MCLVYAGTLVYQLKPHCFLSVATQYTVPESTQARNGLLYKDVRPSSSQPPLSWVTGGELNYTCLPISRRPGEIVTRPGPPALQPQSTAKSNFPQTALEAVQAPPSLFNPPPLHPSCTYISVCGLERLYPRHSVAAPSSSLPP